MKLSEYMAMIMESSSIHFQPKIQPLAQKFNRNCKVLANVFVLNHIRQVEAPCSALGSY